MKTKFNLNNKTVFKNFGYLSFMQGFNMLIPLIIFPYLIRVLGKQNYGLVIYGQVIASFFVVLVRFGFNITATKEIAENSINKDKLNEIVSSVLIIKIILFILSFILMSLILPFIPEASNNFILFYFSLYLCLNEVLFPVWYFQGIQKMKFITLINFVSRIIAIILILLFINDKQDYLKVPVFYGFGVLVSGLISLYIIFLKHGVKFYLLPSKTVLKHFKTGFFVFLSRASFVIMDGVSKVFVTSFFGLAELTIYDLVIRITEVARKPFSLLSQAFFPNLSHSKNMNTAKKILYYSTGVAIFFYLFLLFFSDQITQYFLGESDMKNVFSALLILGLSVPLSAITWALGENMLVVNGYIKQYNISTLLQIFIFFLFSGCIYLIYGTLTFKSILILYILPIFAEVLIRAFYVKKFLFFETK